MCLNADDPKIGQSSEGELEGRRKSPNQSKSRPVSPILKPLLTVIVSQKSLGNKIVNLSDRLLETNQS